MLNVSQNGDNEWKRYFSPALIERTCSASRGTLTHLSTILNISLHRQRETKYNIDNMTWLNMQYIYMAVKTTYNYCILCHLHLQFSFYLQCILVMPCTLLALQEVKATAYTHANICVLRIAATATQLVLKLQTKVLHQQTWICHMHKTLLPSSPHILSAICTQPQTCKNTHISVILTAATTETWNGRDFNYIIVLNLYTLDT